MWTSDIVAEPLALLFTMSMLAFYCQYDNAPAMHCDFVEGFTLKELEVSPQVRILS